MVKTLTIAIPTYERASFLVETLDSILPQMTSRVDLIISDNGSKDATGEYNSGYSKEDQLNESTYTPNVQDEENEKVFETILYLDDFQRETASKEQLTVDELARLEFAELKAALKRAIDKLPSKHKQVIELRFYEGKKGNDIAAWLGVTPSRVSHMIQDAIEKVRQSLAAEGFD